MQMVSAISSDVVRLECKPKRQNLPLAFILITLKGLLVFPRTKVDKLNGILSLHGILYLDERS